MTVLLSALVDATIFLALGLTAAALMRQRSASLRHAVLTAGILAALCAPLFELMLPQQPLIRFAGPAAVMSSGVSLRSAPLELAPAETDVDDDTRGGVWAVRLVLGIWAAGALLMAGVLLVSRVRLSRLTWRCVPLAGRWQRMADDLARASGMRRRVRMLSNDDPTLLVSTGILRPRVIVPAGADSWPDDRLRVVLAHELAHIRRFDGAIQLAGEVARIAYWFHPLVWLACRRVRQESEYACDDAVLRGGVDGAEYAAHLLAVARQAAGRHPAWASAPAIAQPSTLERRIAAMLHRERNRDAMTRRALAIGAGVTLVVSMPLAAIGVQAPEPRLPPAARSDVALQAALAAAAVSEAPPATSASDVARAGRARTDVRDGVQPETRLRESAASTAAQQPAGTIGGTVLDQSGGTVPGAQLMLTDSVTAMQFTAVADAAGRFAFRDLLPARYALVAGLPGFTSVSSVVTLESGGSVHRTITLPLGTIEETITVVCAPAVAGPYGPVPAAVRRLAARAAASIVPVVRAQSEFGIPVRVGGNIRPPAKVTNVNPMCPPAAVPATDTWVRLAGRVGADGLMHDTTYLAAPRGMEPAAELARAALDAVRQWTFTPALLNGRPVDVNIAVNVLFRRE